MLLPFEVLRSLLYTLVLKLFPPQPKEISGKVVLITGGAGGIGQELVYKFASYGARVALVDLNEKGMLMVKETVEKKGMTCKTYICDVSNREDVAKLGADVRRDFETVDILVNNAGIFYVKNFLKLKDSEIKRTLEVNLFGTIWMVREFLPDMSERNNGHIVNISSVAGITSFPLAVDYCTSKFGVRGFSEALTADLERLGKTGIHVSIAYPAVVDTPLVSNIPEDVELVMGSQKKIKPEILAEKVVDDVLANKRHIFVPGELWRLGALANLLPVDTMKVLTSREKFGFYEK